MLGFDFCSDRLQAGMRLIPKYPPEGGCHKILPELRSQTPAPWRKIGFLHLVPIDSGSSPGGCLGYPFGDNSQHFCSLCRTADRMPLTPDFRSARHPQRKTER